MPKFSKDELMDFSQKMIAVCNNLGVSYPDDFKDRLMDSDYVESTMNRNYYDCNSLEDVLNEFTVGLIEHPDNDYRRYNIVCSQKKFIIHRNDFGLIV